MSEQTATEPTAAIRRYSVTCENRVRYTQLVTATSLDEAEELARKNHGVVVDQTATTEIIEAHVTDA
jgi:hypothetical protein